MQIFVKKPNRFSREFFKGKLLFFPYITFENQCSTKQLQFDYNSGRGSVVVNASDDQTVFHSGRWFEARFVDTLLHIVSLCPGV